MRLEPDTSIMIRPTQPIVSQEPTSVEEQLPLDLNASLVIRPSQHVVPQAYGLARMCLQWHLSQAIARPVTLVIAGSGMGKTNALARLCHEQTHALPLWYTLDSDDVEPHTLLAHLFWSLATTIPSLHSQLWRDAIALVSGYADWPDVLAHWLDALHDGPQPILLCIDGLAGLDPNLSPLFSQLIRRLHPRLRIVLAFRKPPEDSFWAECVRLQSSGQLSVLTDEAFRFSPAEVHELCVLYGYAVSEQDVLDLHTLTGGWPYLLDYVLHTQAGRPIADVIEMLVTVETGPDLDECLHTILAGTFSPAEIEQLACSSVPSRLAPATVMAACGLPEDRVPLEHWYAAIPAIQEVESGSYVYHRLFRAFLQRLFLRLPHERRTAAVRASAAAAIAVGDWPEATAQLITHGDWAMLCRMLEPRAAKLVLDRRLDGALTEVIGRLSAAELARWPWLLCYLAMEQRISHADYGAACRSGQMAIEQFVRNGDNNGRARALAEVALAQYHLGQYATALAALETCPPPTQPSCAAALFFAAFLSHLGIGALAEAVHAAHQALHLIEREPDIVRRTTWRIALQRNLGVAYHFQGELASAHSAVEDALQMAKQFCASDYAYIWSLYEMGLLEQRAGRLDLALTCLRRAHELVDRSISREPLWRWIVVAEGHALRDMGHLEAAEERYRLGGWGEGDEGPLMLWLLQGQHAQARFAAEARLVAAHASASAFDAINVTVFLALLDFESGATPAVRATLRRAAEHYGALGFRYHRAAVQFHLAAAEYELGDGAAGDRALAEALSFAAAQGYLNFTWWHPARMRALLDHALQAGIACEHSARLLKERGLAQLSDDDLSADVAGCTDAAPPAVRAAERSLNLRCLGCFEVWVDGQALLRKRWQGHRAGAIRMQRMLLYLARNREPQPIDAIVRYVWPDIWNRIDVSTNFHLTLAGLRRVFEPDLDQGSASRFVLTTPQGYQLLPSLDLTVDLDQFLAHMRSARLADAAGDHAAARTAFTQAEQIYTGDFALAKPDPGEAEEYHRATLEAVRWLAHDDLRRGAFDSCIARARRLLREDAWDTAASALLIAAYLNRGNRRAARQQYERFVQLHGQPSPEIMRLARAHWL